MQIRKQTLRRNNFDSRFTINDSAVDEDKYGTKKILKGNNKTR
jgi:hypothetical protein